MQVALYARVSTNNHHQDPEVQLKDLRSFCQYKGWEIVEVYVDKGVSGTKSSRPQLNRLMEDAKLNKYPLVIVPKVPLSGRRTRDILYGMQHVQQHGER